MTNREAHEKAAGMNLDDLFFLYNGIDPNAEAEEPSKVSPNIIITTTHPPSINDFTEGE